MNFCKSVLSAFVLTVLAFGGLALWPTPTAASTSYSDALSGFEYAFTSTEGRFAGSAKGNLPGFWNVDVFHTPLTTNATITNGTFKLWTSIGGASKLVVGSFANGGSITQTTGFSGCVNQDYAINGTLVSVGLDGSTLSGSGSYSAVLTHYRATIFGACRTYFASIKGNVGLIF